MGLPFLLDFCIRKSVIRLNSTLANEIILLCLKIYGFMQNLPIILPILGCTSSHLSHIRFSYFLHSRFIINHDFSLHAALELDATTNTDVTSISFPDLTEITDTESESTSLGLSESDSYNSDVATEG